MNPDIWKDLAEKLAKRICPFIEFKGGGTPVEEKFLADLLEKEIKEFADKRIARICFMVGEDEDISETS